MTPSSTCATKPALTEGQTKLVAPVIKCTSDVFSMMLGWDIELVGVVVNDKKATRHDCSGIVGVSGAIRGSIVVSLDKAVAISAAEAFLGERPECVNAEVVDTVGELTNMIGGSSKDRLGVPGISLGLPTVVTGKDHSIFFDPGASVMMLRFNSPHGPLTVEVAIVGLSLD